MMRKNKPCRAMRCGKIEGGEFYDVVFFTAYRGLDGAFAGI